MSVMCIMYCQSHLSLEFLSLLTLCNIAFDICNIFMDSRICQMALNENKLCHEKTCFLHMRIQRCRSAVLSAQLISTFVFAP